jgi:hypothetical protein
MDLTVLDVFKHAKTWKINTMYIFNTYLNYYKLCGCVL